MRTGYLVIAASTAAMSLWIAFNLNSYREREQNAGGMLSVTSHFDPIAGSGPIMGLMAQDCGAVGNGLVDDTDAINQCVTRLSRSGGGTLVFRATGQCYMAQSIDAAANVRFKGDGMGSCLRLKPRATGPLFQTENAYLYMHRSISGTTTEESTSFFVTEAVGVGAGDTLFVVDDYGRPHTAVARAPLSGPAVPVIPETWSGGPFIASPGSWWGNASSPGPANVWIEDILIDGNKQMQHRVNSNVAESQILPTGGDLQLVGGIPKFTPYSNLYLEFYSEGDLSAVVFTVTCSVVRSDFFATASPSLTFTMDGPQKGIVHSPRRCNSVSQIRANRPVLAPLVVGAADGPNSLDGVVAYGAMPRLRNVTAQNFRGWSYRFGFVPGIGFKSNTPIGMGNNYQGQEAYLENLQSFSANGGDLWLAGPNDTRIRGFTGGFGTTVGVWFDRWSSGTKATQVHISGGNDGRELREPQIGILYEADSVHCTDCISEEANVNVEMNANNGYYTASEVFHADDSSDRTGVKLGDLDFNTARIRGYVLTGLKCKNLGGGCIDFYKDGGWGYISATGYVAGAFAGKPAYTNTPLSTPASSASYIDLNVNGAAEGTSPLHQSPGHL